MKGLYFAKSWFTRHLSIFIKLAVRKNLSPDLFTWIGVVGAILASLALVWNLWFLVGIGLIVRLGGANLDGAVARAQGSSSKFGFILNEIGDRLSDYIIMIGLSTIAWHSASTLIFFLSIGALITASLPTLISISGTTPTGGVRINGGPFGKTERCATIFILSIALAFGAQKTVSILVTCILIILGSIATAVLRAKEYNKIFLEDLEGEIKL